MRIAIGSDHAGFQLKQAVLDYLRETDYEVVDCGTFDEQSVDYPDVARMVAETVGRGEAGLGILVCGTGIGMCMTANKVPGARAALCHDTFSAHTAREHNDANVLCLGQRVIGPGLAREIVETFLAAEFVGGRHARRVDKIKQLDAARSS